jgi:pyruvate,water dikinase
VTTHVLPLSKVGLADADRVGRKAAVLGELAAAGFAVPAGFAVTASAASVGWAELAADVAEALTALGPGPVAVRSSGVDEDLDGMSYAGLYETVLGVQGLDAVLVAMRTCWASASAERVAAYRNGHACPPAMGVLVQVMVDAAVAGVAFSANPLTGDGTETVVNAVPGLGDRLVSGEVTAEEWTVGGAVAVRRAGVDNVLTESDAHAVARLAQRVASHFGTPQDIEWAVADGTVWLLQARPITALPDRPVEPVPVDIEIPPGYSTRNRSMDRPWTPMERSVFLPVFSAAVRRIFAYTTGAVPAAHSVGGWVYVTVQPDTAEAYVARLERVARDIAEGRPHELVRQWHRAWKPGFASAVAELRDVDLPALDDVGLQAHLDALLDLFGVLHDRYFRLTGAAIAVGIGLGAICGELLGWTPAQTARLRGGLAGDHMAATVRLSELAALDPDGADFAAGFDDYVRRYGHRTVGFDLTEPTLAEQPAVLRALVRTQAAQPYDFAAERAAVDARVAGAVTEARAVLADRPTAERARFETALAASLDASPIRDEKVFYAVSVWALLRYAVLEVGRRLVDRGAVNRADDVFFLELAEARSALSSGRDQRERVRRHRGQHAWALAHPGPPAYGEPTAPPDVDPARLSPGAQRALRLAQAATGLMGCPPPATGDDSELRGLAASPGRYLGPVRVIRNVTEFGKLRHGDVLVCPETTAQWSMLFPSVGALVTDRGSMLSHPAIIAREYGVPAVVATGTATVTLRDDQLVIVDGAAGTVQVAKAVA